MRTVIVSTLATAFTVAAIVLAPLAMDNPTARLPLLALMGLAAVATFADAIVCHARHCRRHHRLYGMEPRHAS
ncbi:hypothetical protein [Bifidobacterium dentium]|uniref:hypothetical protein n=1 Tax=Bifidobacterium dentium TaxID=1689 RepID=UPI000171655A|nr:hypothetical protein [Bifidobacterium dentium]EDT45876.1 hypothetical protein BIFDEN_01714 [Bifidobacterium dentium ATCC 27678]VEG24040.1 Uncharacterised protein [Bifidobacterium dentium]